MKFPKFLWNFTNILKYGQLSVTLIGLFALLFICLGILDYLLFPILLKYFRLKFEKRTSDNYPNQQSRNEPSKQGMNIEKINNSRDDEVNDKKNTCTDYYFPTCRHIIIPFIIKIIKLAKY